jgi:predicted aldo/keto reductase-like oxidoreductase
MKTDYVDLWFLHILQEEKWLSPEMAKTAERLKKEGKIRFFGFTCHDGNIAAALDKIALAENDIMELQRYAATARQLYAQLPAAARRLDGEDFSQASALCPHKVDIARHMQRAAEVLA